ncbi:uncharacterized protein LOC142355751 [Convolutriloba macropyga]|uniref:uncharacterized protein LOC142355751 n=1 Tax=Convolutriloba macropyga TaxID=536237 RepID=UPI003F520158
MGSRQVQIVSSDQVVFASQQVAVASQQVAVAHQSSPQQSEDMSFLVLGESNLREAMPHLWQDHLLQQYAPVYNGVGGRRSGDLLHLVDLAREFTHVFVVVGDNDVNSMDVSDIYENFRRFSLAIRPTNVKFAGNLRRKDLDVNLVASNNNFLSENLGYQYKSTKLVKRADFDDSVPFHISRDGEGFRHLGAMILSVLDEFVLDW